MKTARLQTFVCAGEAFKLPGSNEVHVLPVQLFRVSDGFCFRIGDTAYFFREDGKFDGVEMKVNTSGQITEATTHKIAKLLEETEKNRGKAPTESYYQRGSKGYAEETKDWPPSESN